MKANDYIVLQHAVEQGVMWGWNDAHKHVDEPDEMQIKDAMHNAIMNEICTWFRFEENDGV